jgi:imidazole glycerol-phosphate synthase subunit HisH
LNNIIELDLISHIVMTEEGYSFYFVHSFMAELDNSEDILAQCLYEELLINAVVKKDNITGSQFHSEKSGPSGLKILEQFVP